MMLSTPNAKKASAGLGLWPWKKSAKPKLKQSTIFIHPAFKNVSKSQLGNGTLVIGSPGSGKTTIILPYLKKLADTGQKLATLDVKGEQFEKLGIPFMAPWLHGSLVLDIGSDITTLAQAQLLSNILVPVPEGGKEKVWAASANTVAAGLIYSLVQEKPLAWTWDDLANRLDLTIEEWLALMVKHSPAGAKLLSGAEETSSSVAFNVVTSMRNLRTVASMFAEARKFGGKMFSVKRWLHEKDYSIKQFIMRFDRENAASVGFIIPFIIDYIGSQISGLPNNSDDPKNIVLDEFAQLPAISAILEFYEVGRSKGFNTLLATQDWRQVKEKYGDNRAAIIYSNASIKIVARIAASDMQTELAQLLGSKEVAILNVSQSSGGNSSSTAPSVSTSFQEKNLQLVLPGELETSIGPHSYIANPKGGDAIPTKIRAYLKPMSGDVFALDWPVVFFKDCCKSPVKLPSHHPSAELVRNYLRDSSKTRGEQIASALADERLGMSKIEFAALLFADGQIKLTEWKKAKLSESEASAVLRVFTHQNRASTSAPDSEPPAHKPTEPAALQALPAEATERPSDDAAELLASLIDCEAVEAAKPSFDHPVSGPEFRFEGLQQSSEQIEEADEGAEIAQVVSHAIAPTAEAAHGVALITHAAEVLEMLEGKQAPAPILTSTTPTESAPSLTPLQAAQARIAAAKRKAEHQQRH